MAVKDRAKDGAICRVPKNTFFRYKNTLKEVSGEHSSLLKRTLESQKKDLLRWKN